MGNYASKSQSITREQLLKSTENSRDFTNKLFNVMISKLTPEDFLKLSKSQTCSSFVFLMADSIGKMFDNLQIHPKRDKDTGIVFFQKVDVLRAQTAESRQLCIIIAYFYVRVFQIFGALAMTIIDDPSAGATLGIMKYRPQEHDTGILGYHGRYLPKQYLPGTRGAMIGGADQKYFMSSPILRKFLSIRELLNNPELISIAGESDKQGLQFMDSQIYVMPNRSDSRNIYMPFETGYLLCAMTLTEPAKRSDGTFQMSVGLNNHKIVDDSADSATLSAVNAALRGPRFVITFKIISIDNKQSWYKDGETLVETLEDQLQKIVRRARDYIQDPTKMQVQPGKPGMQGQQQARIGQTNIGVHHALVNEYIIRSLKGIAGYKTTPFCVARAIQLIDANSLFNPKPTELRSGICSARFDILPISVPEPKRGITSIPGLKALDQLYYENPHLEADKVKFDADMTYADFLLEMNGIFGTKGATPKLTSLDSVIAKDPNCPVIAVKHYLRVQDPVKIQKILGIVKQLFGKQLSHTESVLKFFKTTLFNIKKTRDPATGGTGSYIEIHPKLLQGGIDSLAVVSKQARKLLVDYYKGCEETYQLGVQEVLNSNYTVVP